MKTILLPAMLLTAPAAAWAQAPADDGSDTPIIVTGAGLPLPPGFKLPF